MEETVANVCFGTRKGPLVPTNHHFQIVLPTHASVNAGFANFTIDSK